MKVPNHYLLLIAILLCNFVNAQTYPNVTTDRPRINIENDQFTNLKTYINAGNNRATTLFNDIGPQNEGDILNVPNIKLTDTITTWHWEWFHNGNTSEYSRAFNATRLVLLYYNLSKGPNPVSGIDHNLQKVRINYLVTKMIEKIDEINANHTFDGSEISSSLKNELRMISTISPVLLDWGYDAINASGRPSLRNEFVHKLWDINYNYMKYFVYRDFFPQGFPNNNYAGGHTFNDHLHAMKLTLALHHSSELNSTELNALGIRYRFMYDDLTEEFLKIFKFYAEYEGSLSWGGNYSRFLRQYLIEYFDLITTATDFNLYSGNGSISNNNYWINEVTSQHFYFVSPDNYTLHFGDGSTNLNNAPFDHSVISLFNRFDTNVNRYLMNLYVTGVTTPSSKLRELLLRDFSTNEAPTSYSPPKDWYSSKSGILVSKSSFDDEGTMVVVTNATTNFNNHHHRDNNSFQIYKNGPLFFDSGTYDGILNDHHKYYYSRTIAHNTITVFDPNEKFLDHPGIDDNDGGQLLKPPLKNHSAIVADYNDNTDSWKKVIIDSDYNYSITDASSSYNSNKVSTYLKKFLYLKNEDRVIVLDFIEQPASTAFTVKWLAHFKNQPTVLDRNTGLPVPTGISPIIKFLNNENAYLINNGNLPVGNSPVGNAHLKNLYPDQITSTLVGGANHEYFVFDDGTDTSGTNFPLDPGVDTSRDANWRLEIKPTTQTRWTRFVNTIDIGDTDDPSYNTSEFLSQLDKTISLVWDDVVYCFSNKYSDITNTSHKVTIQSLSATTNLNILAFDLTPNASFVVKVDGNTITLPSSTNSEGVFEAQITINGSENLLEIVSSGINSKSLNNNKAFSMYPNEAEYGEEVFFVLNHEIEEESELTIYNLSRQELIKKTFSGSQTSIPNLKLDQGLYIVVISNSKMTEEKKLLVK